MNKSAFTLIELMVVVAIVGVLAAVAIPSFEKFRIRAILLENKIKIDYIRKVANVYEIDFGDNMYFGSVHGYRTLKNMVTQYPHFGQYLSINDLEGKYFSSDAYGVNYDASTSVEAFICCIQRDCWASGISNTSPNAELLSDLLADPGNSDAAIGYHTASSPPEGFCNWSAERTGFPTCISL